MAGGAGEDETQFKSAVTRLQLDTIYLFGRRTYEHLAAFWPHQPGRPPQPLHHVCGHPRRHPSGLANAQPLDGELVSAATEIKADHADAVVVPGRQTSSTVR
jgi:hypothetical protein